MRVILSNIRLVASDCGRLFPSLPPRYKETHSDKLVLPGIRLFYRALDCPFGWFYQPVNMGE